VKVECGSFEPGEVFITEAAWVTDNQIHGILHIMQRPQHLEKLILAESEAGERPNKGYTQLLDAEYLPAGGDVDILVSFVGPRSKLDLCDLQASGMSSI